MNRVYIPVVLRQAVIERAAYRCEYCHSPAPYSPEIFEFEHIQPISTGGVTELPNLAFSCPACNRYKGILRETLDPETGQMTSLFNPRQDIWVEHFVWSDDFIMITGLTPIGRATIEKLQMNRPAVQRFRAALYAIGVHPA